MRDEPNLLAGIRANPDDDAPRLVYADWLDEHGQPDRAEFIRVQVERARTPHWHPDYSRLKHRNQDLLGEFQLQWAKPVLDVGVVDWEFRRGFLEHISASPAALTAAPALCRRLPTLQSVELCEQGDYEQLLRMHTVTAWRSLSFNNDCSADEVCSLLAQSSQPMALRTLDCSETFLSKTVFAALCANSVLPHLQMLNLGEMDLDDESYAAFAAAPFAKQLRTLTIAGVWHNEASLYRFPFTALTTLTVDRQHVRALATLQPAGAPSLPIVANLHTCWIKKGFATEEDCDWGFLLNNPRLQRLLVEPPTLNAEQVQQTLDMAKRHGMERIVIDNTLNRKRTGFRLSDEPQPATFELCFASNNAICDLSAWLSTHGYLATNATATLRGWGTTTTPQRGSWPELPTNREYGVTLEQAAQPECLFWQRTSVHGKFHPATLIPYVPTTRTEPQTQFVAFDGYLDWPEDVRVLFNWDERLLSFWSAKDFTDAKLRDVVNNPVFANIRELDLGATSITLKGVQALVESPYVERLYSLRLSFNELGDGLAEMLADAPNLRRLATLKLSFCNIGDHGVRALAKSPYLTRLTTLKLWQGSIGNTGAKAIASSETLANLRGLRLRNNAIEDAGAIALAESRYFRWLRELDIMSNPIGDDGMRALNERFGGKLGYAIGDFEDFPE